MNFQEFIESKSIELEQIDRAYQEAQEDIKTAKSLESQVTLLKQNIKELLTLAESKSTALKIAVNAALLEELTITPKLPEVNTMQIIRSPLLSPVLNEVIGVEQDLGDPVEHNIVEFRVPVEDTGKDDTDTTETSESQHEAVKEKRQRKTAKGFERKCAEWLELLRTVETEQQLDNIKEEINQWRNYELPSDLVAALDAVEQRISALEKSSEPLQFKPSDLVDESGIYQGDIPEEDEDETEPTPQVNEQELINKFETALKSATTLEDHQKVCDRIRESDIVDMRLIRTIESTKDLLSQKVIEQTQEKEIETVVTGAFEVPATDEIPKSPFAGKKRKTEARNAEVAGVDPAETPVASERISLGGIDTETKIKIKNFSGIPVELTRHSEDYILPVGTKVYDSAIDCAYSVCEWDEAELMNPAINKDGSKIPVVSLFDDRIYLVISSLDKIVLVSEEEAQQLVQAYQKKIEAISSGDVFA